MCKVNFRGKKKQVKMELIAPDRHMLRAVTSKLCQTRGIPRNWSEMHTPGASLWSSSKNPPASAGEAGLIPGKVRYAAEQPSPCATSTEPMQSPRVATSEPPHSEWRAAPSHSNGNAMQQQRPSLVKNK